MCCACCPLLTVCMGMHCCLCVQDTTLERLGSAYQQATDEHGGIIQRNLYLAQVRARRAGWGITPLEPGCVPGMCLGRPAAAGTTAAHGNRQ